MPVPRSVRSDVRARTLTPLGLSCGYGRRFGQTPSRSFYSSRVQRRHPFARRRGLKFQAPLLTARTSAHVRTSMRRHVGQNLDAAKNFHTPSPAYETRG